jgi:cytidylate kinase
MAIAVAMRGEVRREIKKRGRRVADWKGVIEEGREGGERVVRIRMKD